jgi:hypothetical protein
MDDDSTLYVLAFFGTLVLFGLGILFGVGIAGKPDTYKEQVVCDYLGGEWHGDICVKDGQTVQIVWPEGSKMVNVP